MLVLRFVNQLAGDMLRSQFKADRSRKSRTLFLKVCIIPGKLSGQGRADTLLCLRVVCETDYPENDHAPNIERPFSLSAIALVKNRIAGLFAGL